MTMAINSARSREIERGLVREAITAATVHGSIERLLGDELIAAARETVRAWHARPLRQSELTEAIRRLEDLVGRP